MILFLDLLKYFPPAIMIYILNAVNELIKQVETNEYMAINILSKYTQNHYQVLLSLSQNIALFDPKNNIPMNALYTLGIYG